MWNSDSIAEKIPMGTAPKDQSPSNSGAGGKFMSNSETVPLNKSASPQGPMSNSSGKYDSTADKAPMKGRG